MTLASYISSIFDQFDPLDKILDALQYSRLPPIPMDPENKAQLGNIDDAVEAIRTISTIFGALNETPQPKTVEEYTNLCYRRLVDQWGSLTQWIANLILNSSNLEDARVVMLCCAKALLAIIDKTHGNAYKEDLVNQYRTVDLVFLLLCEKDRSGGSRRYVTGLDRALTCPIIELFRSYFFSQVGYDTAKARLEAAGRSTRSKIIAAILERSEELATLANDAFSLDKAAFGIRCLVASTFCLVSSLPLWVSFHSRNFLNVQARVFSALCEKIRDHERTDLIDFWESVSGGIFALVAAATDISIINPGARIRELVEGGILGCALQCLPHVGPSASGGVYEALRALLPYMTLSKVYEAAIAQGDLHEWSRGNAQPYQAQEAWADYEFIFKVNRYIHVSIGRGDARISLCANRKVGKQYQPHRPVSLTIISASPSSPSSSLFFGGLR